MADIIAPTFLQRPWSSIQTESALFQIYPFRGCSGVSSYTFEAQNVGKKKPTIPKPKRPTGPEITIVKLEVTQKHMTIQ